MVTTRPAYDSGALKRRLSGLQSPDFQTNLIQVLKSVIAATAGWWLSVNVLGSSMPFLAPWTALLTVHATVYRSLSRGFQMTVTTGLGVVLSLLIGSFLGVSLWTFALAMLIGLAGSFLVWIRDEGIVIATTAIFILGAGFDNEAPLLVDRLLQVGLGVTIGIVVNLLLVPPLRDLQAARHVDSLVGRMGDVLIDIANETAISWQSDRHDAWIEETISIDQELRTAWQTVRFVRESQRMNPRHWFNQHVRADQNADYEKTLEQLGEGIPHLRHLARTLREPTYVDDLWDDEFRMQWAAIVTDVGTFIKDPAAHVEPIYDRLRKLSVDSFNDGLPRRKWPIYGAFITSVRQIITAVDDVSLVVPSVPRT